MIALEIVRIDETLVADVAVVHREVFRGYMNERLGASYARTLVRWFQASPDRIALAAVDPHLGVIGYVLGAPSDSLLQMSRYLFKSAIAGLVLHPWLMFRKDVRHVVGSRCTRLLGSSRPTEIGLELPQPIVSLVGIGVKSAARGLGVGDALMSAFEEEARKLSARAIHLTVYDSNERARALYERAGWNRIAGLTESDNSVGYAKLLSLNS